MSMFTFLCRHLLIICFLLARENRLLAFPWSALLNMELATLLVVPSLIESSNKFIIMDCLSCFYLDNLGTGNQNKARLKLGTVNWELGTGNQNQAR